MIRLYAGNQGIFEVPFVPGETADQFLIRFKDIEKLHFKGGASLLQCVSDGHTVSSNEIMLERDYYLSGWLANA